MKPRNYCFFTEPCFDLQVAYIFYFRCPQETSLDHLSLGKKVEYAKEYDNSLLQRVARSLSRDSINLPKQLPFHGTDIWNGYELSWLNTKGKPQVAILRCEVPITSPNLIESKSFKLYLNSLNQSQFANVDEVTQVLSRDLSNCAGENVTVHVIPSTQFDSIRFGQFSGICIDDLDIEINDFDITPELLKLNPSTKTQEPCSETLVSHLLKSNCLITNQPDWGSILIKYTGSPISREGLLRYLISFRQHNEFHEQCVERIFYDILQQCKPQKLTVYARYTRRGGLDINPFRSNFEAPYQDARLARQ
ncbi:MAG: 7-cyano-7-deazaguanine reductase [Glaciecola sp.]|jgi:7-cyano-7-deazaguanine reductase